MPGVEEERLELEKQKLREEMEARRIDQQLQRDQFEFTKARSSKWAQVLSPVGIAILSALIGFLTSVYTGLQNSHLERQKEDHAFDLERKKEETSLLLKLSEIPDEKLRASSML